MATKSDTVVKAHEDDAKWYWLAEGWSDGGFVREVDYASNVRGVDPLFEGIKIVDCDTHFTEPADLWTANAPAGMKDKMPHVRRIDDADQWFVGDKHFGSIGGNVIAKDKNKLLGRLAFRNYDQIAPGSYDVTERLKDMDDMGVWGQVCFQNGGVTQAGSLVALDDEPLAIAITQIYNDACADRMAQSGRPHQLHGHAAVLGPRRDERRDDPPGRSRHPRHRPARSARAPVGGLHRPRRPREPVLGVRVRDLRGERHTAQLSSQRLARCELGDLGQPGLRPEAADPRAAPPCRLRRYAVQLHGLGPARYLSQASRSA